MCEGTHTEKRLVYEVEVLVGERGFLDPWYRGLCWLGCLDLISGIQLEGKVAGP